MLLTTVATIIRRHSYVNHYADTYIYLLDISLLFGFFESLSDVDNGVSPTWGTIVNMESVLSCITINVAIVLKYLNNLVC